jgi:hypothetical protein
MSPRGTSRVDNIALDIALTASVGNVAALFVAIRAWRVAQDARSITTGHALDATAHMRRAADPGAPVTPTP